jgi:hypothetical protein
LLPLCYHADRQAYRRRPDSPEAATTELLRTQLIVQLALAGLPHKQIRSVVGCEMARVTKTLKPLKALLKKRDESEG